MEKRMTAANKTVKPKVKSPEPQNVLVIDVGGTHVKFADRTHKTEVKIDSGPTMTVRKMAAAVKAATADWKYSAVSIGYPGPVLHGRPVAEPHNLGRGWVGFDYKRRSAVP
jgi:predicted NBD/HSP70 family sugar kinase